MAATKTTMSFTGTAIVLANQKAIGIVAPPNLDRSVSLLAENVHKATTMFYNIQKALMEQRRHSRFLEGFNSVKTALKSEYETLHRILQCAHRHGSDFTASCQRAPDDRSISAQRCQRSGKAVLRDIQEANRTFDIALDGFKDKRQALAAIWSADFETSDSDSASDEKDPHTQIGNTVSLLYDTLDGVQLCLKDLFVFWDNHVSFLTLVLNRQSNFPAPGQETKSAVHVWTEYQKTILQASNSMSESADAMGVTPTISSIHSTPNRRIPWRSHTYPKSSARKLVRTNTLSTHRSSAPEQCAASHGSEQSHRGFSMWLMGLIRRLF